MKPGMPLKQATMIAVIVFTCLVLAVIVLKSEAGKGEGTKTSSGLQSWDIKVGTGRAAERGNTVKVHYTGWLTNGKKFDSSVGGQPFQFRIGAHQVIAGWEEGVTGMKVGGKRQLRIPPDLAYGKEGYPGAIPPNATLVFDIELLRVE